MLGSVGYMTSQTTSYDEQPPLQELASDCRCVTEECTCHGISLEPPHHDAHKRPPESLGIEDETVELLEGYADYGD